MTFQDQFKKAFENDNVDWNKEDLWNDIEPHLPKKKKNRKFLIILFFFSIVLLAVIYMSSNSTLPAKVDLTSEAMTNTNKIIELSAIQDANSKASDSSMKTVTPNKKHSEINVSHLLQSNSKIIDSDQDHVIYRNKIKFEREIAFQNPDSLLWNDVNNEFINDKKKVSTVDIFSSKSVQSSQTILLSDSLSQGEARVFNESYHQHQNDSSLTEIYDTANASSPILFNDSIVESKRHFSISLNTYIGKSQQSLKDMKGLLTNFVDLHNDSKETKEIFGIDMMVHRSFHKGLIAGIGLDYNRNFEWYNGSISIIEEILIETDTALYFINNGIKEFVEGQQKQTTTYNTHYRSPVTRSRINIPIELAYAITKNDWSINIYSRFNFGVYFHYEGTSYDIDMNLIRNDIKKLQQLYKTKAVHSYSLGLNFEKILGKHWLFKTGAKFMNDLNSSIQPEFGITERYSSIGLVVGFNYNFK